MSQLRDIQGVGLGLKRELIPQIQALYGQDIIRNIDFLEIAPENWIGAGGKYQAQLDWFTAVSNRVPWPMLVAWRARATQCLFYTPGQNIFTTA